MKVIKVPKKYSKVYLDGSSIWGNTKDLFSVVNSIEFHFNIDSEEYDHIYVNHNLYWEIYTDNGFEKGISDLVRKLMKIPDSFKCKKRFITFTEQGMQTDYKASMEFNLSNRNYKKMQKYLKKNYLIG